MVEKISKIESRAIYSSEFLIKNLIPQDENTLYIFITQSGETSDTLKALERVKKETNLPTLCITNNENSTIWNKCDYKVACYAGIEHGIAAEIAETRNTDGIFGCKTKAELETELAKLKKVNLWLIF